MTATVYGIVGYTTWGSVRGQGPVRSALSQANEDLTDDRRACESLGGYSDRVVVVVDEDGFLHHEDGAYVWPSHGRANGAVRAAVRVK